MQLHTMPQRTPEWYAIRNSVVITGSEVGAFVYAVGKDGKPTKTTTNAREGHILKRLTRPLEDDETLLGYEIEQEIKDKEEKFFEYDPDIKRGRLLEPYAVRAYEQLLGLPTHEVGFLTTDDGFTCGVSPDRLVGESLSLVEGGLEVKYPKKWIVQRYHLQGILPDAYAHQIHTSLAISGLPWWDFFAFSAGVPPFYIRVTPNKMTSDIKMGLEGLAVEFRQKREILAEKYDTVFDGRWKDIEL